MELDVLGDLRVREGEREVKLRPVERRLVAALAACRPSSVRYATLADAVWGDEAPRSATRSLQTHVLRVRSATCRDAVQTVATGYRLGDGVVVDLDGFTAALRQAEGADDQATALAWWDDALSRWRGTPFDELENWPPAVAERTRLNELWERAQEGRCSAALAVTPAPDLVAEVESLVQAEPSRERRWCLLLSALAAVGRHADALRAFDRARRALARESGISPGRELRGLYEALLAEPEAIGRTTVVPRPASPSGRLPAAVSSIIGRDDEVGLVVELLGRGRMVTLSGPPGVGKTRLAVEAAERWRAAHDRAAWFVELATTRDPAAVDAFIASALGFVASPGHSPRDTIAGAIGDRELLVVLDNCEHLLATVADFVTDVLARCARLRIVATSREPLTVSGERTMRVAALPLDGAAAELFVARAVEADPGFVVDDRAALAAVLAWVDGLPLAIELTAARVRTLGLGGLAARLGEHFDKLTTRRRGSADRHRTLRAAVDWSYDLLDGEERAAFQQVAVFSGRFELDAVQQVVELGGAEVDVVSALSSLVDKSLIVADGDVGEARFRWLEPLHQYARQRLIAAGDADAVAGRHRRYFAALASQLDLLYRGRDQIDALRRLDAARANMRAAFQSAIAHADTDTALTIAAALRPYASGQIWTEPWTWCTAALELPGARGHPLRAAILVGASEGAWQVGEHGRSAELAETAIASAAPGDDVWHDAHRIMATALMWLGRFEEAERTATEGVEVQPSTPAAAQLTGVAVLALIRNRLGRRDAEMARQLLRDARALGNPRTLALAFHTAGAVLGHDDPALELAYQRHAAGLAASCDAVVTEGFALASLAARQVTIDPVAGARAYVSVVNHYLRVGNRTHLRNFARGLIYPFATVGSFEAAAIVDGATEHEPDLGNLGAERLAALSTVRGHLGIAFDDIAARGAAMTDDELVEYVNDAVHHIEQPTADAPAAPSSPPDERR